MTGFRSIRWRIAIPYALLILIILAGLGYYLSARLRDAQLGELETRLEDQTRMIAEAAFPLLESGDRGAALDDLADGWAEILGSRVTIIAEDGIVLGESHQDRSQMDNHLTRPEVVQAGEDGKGNSVRYSRTVGFSMLYSALSVDSGQQNLGYIRVALPLEEIEDSQLQLRQTIFAAMVVAAILAIILGVLIAERTTLPLRSLSESVSLLADGDLNVRIVPTTRDEVGTLTRSINTMTARLQTQFVRLEDERMKLAAVLNQMTDGVLMVDAQGAVLLMNSAGEDLFDYDHELAVGRSLIEVVRYHQIVDLWELCKSSGEVQSMEFEGGQAPTSFGVSAIPFADTLEGNVLILVRDLTQVRRLETMRRDFISNISHELRTPLASLKALVDTLVGGAIEDPADAQHFLNQMDGELDSLTQMVQELFELSRIESGRVPLKRIDIDPGELLNAAGSRIKIQAERAGVMVSVSYPEDLPPVFADPDRISQVLGNLLHNAVKFTPEGGRISLSAYQKVDRVIIKVEDTGVGIPAEGLPRIFERFYKADRSRSGGGTGLGLAISRHLVEAHGGQIWAESTEGRGSSFFFTLPVSHQGE